MKGNGKCRIWGGLRLGSANDTGNTSVKTELLLQAADVITQHHNLKKEQFSAKSITQYTGTLSFSFLTPTALRNSESGTPSLTSRAYTLTPGRLLSNATSARPPGAFSKDSFFVGVNPYVLTKVSGPQLRSEQLGNGSTLLGTSFPATILYSHTALKTFSDAGMFSASR